MRDNFDFLTRGFSPTVWAHKYVFAKPAEWKHREGESELATLGGGAFFGVEKFFAHDFEERNPGAILGTSVGFMTSNLKDLANPSYEDVCNTKNSYKEVVHILYSPKKTNYEEIIKFFFSIHDPTIQDIQGHDLGPYANGPQYASAVFTHSEK